MQFFDLKLEPNEELSSLINRLKSICTQLVYIESPFEDEDKVAVLLKALPPPYNQIVTVLKEKEHVPSLESAINSLLEERKKLGTTSKFDNQAFIVHSSHKKACQHCGKDNHKSQDCYRIKTCPHYCGKIGHASNRCYSKDKAAKDDKGKGQVSFVEDNTPTSYESDNDIC